MPLQQPCTASDGRHRFIHDGTAETSATGDIAQLKAENMKLQKQALSLAGVSSKPSVPVPSFKLNVKRPKGHVSGSYLVHKVLQLQFPLNQPSQKPGSSGSAVADTANKSDLESDNDLLQSDTESATLLLPTVAESINTYTSVLSSLQFSMLSHSGSISSTADSSPSVETLTSSDSSLPRGFSARYIQVMGHQVHTALHILKTLVTYSIPVRRMLIQQVCSELATGLSQTEGSPDNSIKEICGCCLLKKLCHLANHKLYDLCVLTLDILTTTLQCCPANHLERILDNLPICDVILACISEDVEDVTNRFQLGFSVLRLIHTLVRSERVIRMMCTKTVDCIFYNVYSFCVQSLTDQPENRSIVHETKFVQILASILTHDRATSSVLVSIDCHCGEILGHLYKTILDRGVSPLRHLFLGL
ncbi:hypothetical protein LSH36_971g00061 [Paralvinella palmiformis]|uniref:Uncharacterized protein n=1 Tax=Paralvinella palmiformis TaxID=53620 RepID=A0AAD9MSL3_9ANNE|nr:hypothetical protein LSH36_971g00061 [Paralvinella palmiformis]